MYDALVEACDRVDADDTVRVFVVRAAGDAFAAGTDIRQFTGFASGDDGIAYERRLDAVIDRLERVSVPTIAQVHGVAAGGGCAIALTCDLRVCTPTAQFGVPIARTLGNCLSAANLARLVDLVGPARTKELLFTGRLLDATEAASLGLVTRMAEPGRHRHGSAGPGAGDCGQRPADHSRHQRDGSPHRRPATSRSTGGRRHHRRVLREPGFSRRRRRVSREAAPPLHRPVTASA